MTLVSLEQFLKENEKRAYKMALIATRSQDDALDIVQDAMMKLVQSYADRSISEWGPLFTRILQNRIRDWYRSQSVKNRWQIFFDHQLSRQSDQLDGSDTRHNVIENAAELKNNKPENKLEQARAMQTLNRELEKLPHRQQQAFLLRCWQGLSVSDTAIAMKCSEGSVKTHYSRATHRLRDMLKDYL